MVAKFNDIEIEHVFVCGEKAVLNQFNLNTGPYFPYSMKKKMLNLLVFK